MRDKIFSAGSEADDMVDWSEKLVALGNLVNCAAEAEEHGDGTLAVYGAALGSIIADYAGALNFYVSKAFPALVDFYSSEEGRALLKEHNERRAIMQKSSTGREARAN